MITFSTALLTSMAILITNEYISTIKRRLTQLGDWIIVVSSLYEKTLKTSMIFKKIDEKEAWELKKNYNQ